MFRKMAFFFCGLLVLPLATGLAGSAVADTVPETPPPVAVSIPYGMAVSESVSEEPAGVGSVSEPSGMPGRSASDPLSREPVVSAPAVSADNTETENVGSAEASSAMFAVGVEKTVLRALPDRLADPEIELESTQKATDALACLRRQLSVKMGLPDEFIQLRTYANNVQTLALHNPFTRRDGVLLDIHQHTLGSSVIRLYANGTIVSRAWRNLPASCR